VILHLVIRTSVVYRNLCVPAVQLLMPGWLVSPPGYYGLPLATAAIGGLCAYLGSGRGHASAIDWVYRAYTIFALIDAALLLLTLGPYILP